MGGWVMMGNPSPRTPRSVPVRDDAVLHGVLELEETAQLLRLSTHKHVALQGAGHHAQVFRPANAIRPTENSSRVETV